MNEEGFVTDLQRFCYAESGGLQLWARVVRLCGHSLVHLSPEERSRLLRTAHKIHITVIPPDENGKPRRSFSELYQKAIKDAECKSGEDKSGVAWVVDEREDEREEQEQKVEEEQLKADRVDEEEEDQLAEDELKMDGGGGQNEESPGPLLTLPALPLLRATSLQDQPANKSEEISISHLTRSVSLEKQLSYTDTCDEHVYDNVMMMEKRHIYENVGELRDATPDLILAVKPKVPPEDEQFMAADFGEDKASASDSSLSSSRLSSVDRAERNSRALSLHNSITKILSETTDSTDEEWQSIADLATACRSILEALSKEDRKAGDSSQGGVDQTDGKFKDSKDSDSPGHLEEKVSQLEAMLKKLQDDLQKWAHKEKEDKAVLQAEVQSLRQNNQRLQEESQSTVARLIKVTELLCNVNKPC
ncbi:PREDICTED: signal-induced proliferation-associated protein 1-like [Poecilia mexicana]|nr:PREDICTED: signal-induced proliferation-associated protein 1-like [Poecilia mexicana]